MHRLGPLELAVLDALWSGGSANVDGMHVSVGIPRGLARNTIQSTLERLVRKGLVSRSKRGRAFEYRAVLSRAEWAARALRELFDTIPQSDAQLMIATFADLTERVGEEGLEQLEALIRERRRARRGDGE